MYIKLNVQGELLELLQNESKEEFRSPTQQVMYILNKHYKDKLSSSKVNESVVGTRENSIINKKEPQVLDKEDKEPTGNREELIIDKDTQDELQQYQEGYDYIDDDMIDF